jgi:hypothetical protein
MDAVVHAPLGLLSCFIPLSRILGVRDNRSRVVSPVDPFWNQVSQNDGANIRHRDNSLF